MAQRRTLLLALFRTAKPLLRGIQYAGVIHREESCDNWFRETDPQGPKHRGARLDSDQRLIGLSIRMRRLSIGLTQEELGRNAGITRTHVIRIEQGRCRLRSSTRRRLERGLGWEAFSIDSSFPLVTPPRSRSAHSNVDWAWKRSATGNPHARLYPQSLRMRQLLRGNFDPHG
ncbi:MAG: helix-turn-helix transcriptional regulator [Bdellovibrionales bacterium]|nr:helix-turn-helix transcriptional regulator [Bdellovibrionales bacterium]